LPQVPILRLLPGFLASGYIKIYEKILVTPQVSSLRLLAREDYAGG
jgi:hypothetical protein